MTQTERLEQLLYDNGITLYNFALENIKAFSMPNTIVVDQFNIDSAVEYRIVLAEEIGHCLENAFYPLNYCGDADRLKRLKINIAERRAKNFAIRELVPIEELKRALSACDTDYAVAEMLGITESFLCESVNYYKRKNLL